MAHAVVDFVSKRSEPERIVVRAESALTAAAGRASHRDRTASRRLVDIDRELRAKVHTAANAAVKRALERAGAKIVSKSRGKGAEAVRASISGVPQHRIAATVGPAVIAALGLDAKALSDAEFAELEQQWQAWVSTGQEQALRQAARIAGVDVNSMYGAVTGTFKDNADAGWAWLQSRLQRAVVSQMSAAPVGEEVAIGADDTFVSMGLVRGALSIAGGFLDKTGTAGISDSGQPVDPSEGMGGIGTGETVSQALQDAGAATDGYTWVHGPSSNPFEPHLNLDGVDFSSFDDDALTNDENFPDYAFFAPGDHDGCSCDYMVVWTSGDSTDNTDNSEEG